MTEMTMFEPFKKTRFSDQIAELIQNRILQDRLEIGTRLPSEKELADEFQVSRSVIREALRILEISGLISIKKGPTGGIFVAHIYNKPIINSLNNMVTSGEVTVDHLFDVRLLIEPTIAREAALHAKKADLKRLEDLMADSAAHTDDPLHLKQNNLNFHLYLAKASGNPVLSVVLESVIKILIDISLDFFDLSLEKRFYKIHRNIFEHIATKQPAEAEALIKKDVLDVKLKLKTFKSDAGSS